jgi:23S rRNA pseudouridine1911/1915/1917 synthase
MTRHEVIPAALAGERVDRVVALITGCSRAVAVELIGAGGVHRNGRVVTRPADRVDEGDELTLAVEQLPGARVVGPEPDVAVVVVHEDAEVIVVDKAAGQVVHPGAGHQSGTLVAGLLARYPELAAVGEADRPGIVHRLDRETSGLLAVARTPAAYCALVDQLAARTVERRYTTVVWGSPASDQGTVDAPLGRSPRHPTRMAVVTGGREARTHFEVTARFTEPAVCARLTCRLETGRTHQIRVHLQAIGHPVVGDAAYGGVRQSLRAPRMVLHAERLGFTHPVTGAWLTFDSPLPADLAAFIATLK